MRVVEYDYKPEFASAMGINTAHQTGTCTSSFFNSVLSPMRILILNSLPGGCVLCHLTTSRWSNSCSVKPIITRTGKLKEIPVTFTQHSNLNPAPRGTGGVFLIYCFFSRASCCPWDEGRGAGGSSNCWRSVLGWRETMAG